MRLTSFSVENYRSVNKSGEINTAKTTVLVGRNESGKSNLLLALASLNPPGRKTVPLQFTKDFPRDRHPDEFDEKTIAVRTVWELTSDEQAELGALAPIASGVSTVTVSRSYAGVRQIGFKDCEETNRPQTAAWSADLAYAVKSATSTETPQSQTMKAAWNELHTALEAKGTVEKWAAGVRSKVGPFDAAVKANGAAFDAKGQKALADLVRELDRLDALHEQLAKARKWVIDHMPVFIYVDEYPAVEGHQNIPEYLRRKGEPQRKDEDVNFEKLCKVAGLDPAKLNEMLSKNHEERQLVANRAGAVVTRRLQELWTDRKLKVRFNLDAGHFDTLVSDPANVYDVEVNLNERSRGLRWFFSFYMIFAADTQGGSAENAILLLDEPGLYLHAVAQKDLLRHLREDLPNQIVFTTHSPFMVPTGDLDSVRTVNISQEHGTTVTNDPTGDSKTLFPLQSALGYDLTQTLFVGAKTVVVEGVSDYWYLAAASDVLHEKTSDGLDRRLTLTPAGGAQRVSYMVALLSSQKLDVVVLLDEENRARATSKDLLRERLIRDDRIAFVSEAIVPHPSEADIEDLIDPRVFDALVRETYKTELAGRTLTLDERVPRIVKRYEQAFEKLGIPFNKTRPARLFLRRAAEAPDAVLPKDTQETFRRLFRLVEKKMRHGEGRAPFE